MLTLFQRSYFYKQGLHLRIFCSILSVLILNHMGWSFKTMLSLLWIVSIEKKSN